MSEDAMTDQEQQPTQAPATDAASRPGPPRHRLRTVVFSVLLLAAGAAVAVAAVALRPQPERHSVETPPPLVQVVRAVVEPVSLDVVSQGTVEPVTASSLVAQVAGRVTAVSESFADGAFFRPGQVLLEIDRRDYELALRDAEAALAQARVGLEREQAEADVARREWQELGRGGEPNPLVLHEPQLAQARASVAAAEAAVERARLDLQRTRLSAPFAGRVRAKRADLGQYVTPGTPVADVFSTEAAEIRLPVSKDDLAFLAVGLGWSADGARPDAPVATLRGELAGRVHT
jgi:RND family efflux transporter MFP subunit